MRGSSSARTTAVAGREVASAKKTRSSSAHPLLYRRPVKSVSATWTTSVRVGRVPVLGESQVDHQARVRAFREGDAVQPDARRGGQLHPDAAPLEDHGVVAGLGMLVVVAQAVGVRAGAVGERVHRRGPRSPATGMTSTSRRSPIPVPLRCVWLKPVSTESEAWYPELQSHPERPLSGLTCTIPKGTVAPG